MQKYHRQFISEIEIPILPSIALKSTANKSKDENSQHFWIFDFPNRFKMHLFGPPILPKMGAEILIMYKRKHIPNKCMVPRYEIQFVFNILTFVAWRWLCKESRNIANKLDFISWNHAFVRNMFSLVNYQNLAQVFGHFWPHPLENVFKRCVVCLIVRYKTQLVGSFPNPILHFEIGKNLTILIKIIPFNHSLK